MATSVHNPKPLLDAVDRRARRLKMTRNRFIVRTLETAISHESEWSPGFFDRLAERGAENAPAVDDLLKTILSARTRKKPPTL